MKTLIMTCLLLMLAGCTHTGQKAERSIASPAGEEAYEGKRDRDKDDRQWRMQRPENFERGSWQRDI